MDKPLRVSLVMPPKTTIENTHAHPPPSHQATDRTASSPPRTSACFGTAALATVDIAARLAAPTPAAPPTKTSLALALALAAAFLAFSASPRARAASRVHIPLLVVEVNSRIARTASPFPFLTIHPRFTGVIVTPLVVTPLKRLLESPPPPPPLVSVRNIHRAADDAADADADVPRIVVLRVPL
jgi:hypothetical protein